MSKNKRKGLFGAPQDILLKKDSFQQQNQSIQTESTEQIESEQYHKIVRFELLNVLLIVFAIGLSFTILWYTNEKMSWIDDFSTGLLHHLVRGY
ncbi:MAG: hypothetical protein WC505_08180 [Patescibacteria group bacterium]